MPVASPFPVLTTKNVTLPSIPCVGQAESPPLRPTVEYPKAVGNLNINIVKIFHVSLHFGFLLILSSAGKAPLHRDRWSEQIAQLPPPCSSLSASGAHGWPHSCRGQNQCPCLLSQTQALWCCGKPSQCSGMQSHLNFILDVPESSRALAEFFLNSLSWKE